MLSSGLVSLDIIGKMISAIRSVYKLYFLMGMNI